MFQGNELALVNSLLLASTWEREMPVMGDEPVRAIAVCPKESLSQAPADTPQMAYTGSNCTAGS